MRILLISGHGQGDVGACGCGYQEATLTREVTSMLKKQLSKYATVTVHDTSKDAFKVLNRGGKIDFTKYDYVLEIHFNAFNGNAKGTEVWVTTSEKGTGVEEKIVSNLAKLGFTNRGVKRKDFLVIRSVKKQGVSSALLEVCFIDNKSDMNIYQSKKSQIIDAICKGIVDGFGLSSSNTIANDYKQIVKTKLGLEDATIKYLSEYKFADALFEKIAKGLK